MRSGKENRQNHKVRLGRHFQIQSRKAGVLSGIYRHCRVYSCHVLTAPADVLAAFWHESALAAVCRFLALGIDMHRRAFIALGGAAAAWRRDVDTALVSATIGHRLVALSNTLALCEAPVGRRR
jgi:hypothetical protein